MINVSTRFGGTEEEEEDGSDDEAQALRSSEDSINQGPWGLAAYAYYFWSGATDQVRPISFDQKLFLHLHLDICSNDDFKMEYIILFPERSIHKVLVCLHGCVEQPLEPPFNGNNS